MPQFKVRRRHEKTSNAPPVQVFREEPDKDSKAEPIVAAGSATEQPDTTQSVPRAVHAAPNSDKDRPPSAQHLISEAMLDEELAAMLLESDDEVMEDTHDTPPPPQRRAFAPSANPYSYFNPQQDLLQHRVYRERRRDDKKFQTKTLFGPNAKQLTQDQRNSILDAAIFG